MMKWRLAEAKNKFSEVVRLALTQGPQQVSRRHDSVVVLSQKDYERLVGQRPGFKQLLMDGPDLASLDLTRDTSSMRDVEL